MNGDAPYSLGFRAEFRKISDGDRYVIYTLWVIGYSATAIAAATRLPRKRVLNCVNHSDYANRSAMGDAERRQHLRDLQAIRYDDGAPLDGGRLDAISWNIQPLAPSKIRRREASTS